VAEVLEAIAAHRAYLESSGLWAHRERARARDNLLRALEEELLGRLLAGVGEAAIEDWVDRIARREADVYTAVQSLIENR
jgi:putative protein kinase ArgK-like GTPase of G3E family